MLKPEDIATYLKENPAFFDKHQDLLVNLQLSSEDQPFHQRQIDVLRDRHNAEQAKFALVVDSARKNLSLEQQLHALAQIMLSHSVHSVYHATKALEEHFELHHVAVLGAADDDRSEEENTHYESIAKRVAHGNSVCDDRVSSALLQSIFHDKTVESCAFIPLNSSGQDGVMVLGDTDRDRFQPGMGTVYLDRIGELVSAYLAGCP